MSATSQPITPEFFLQAIRDLELEQLHAESARLQLSLYHLRRSQVALEEFRDDPVCRSAMEDNEIVIRNQVDRMDLIRLEVQRRGFSMEHGVGTGERLVNGNASPGSRENLGRGVIMGGIEEEEGEEENWNGARIEPAVAENTAARDGNAGGEQRRENPEGGDEGIYL